MKVVGIIPCRYASVRFPGKPIALIHGRPMLWHVYQQALKAASLDEVLVATDDERISTVCKALGVPAILTRNDHPTGTDRLAECIASVHADFYVNVQGDEPMIAPEAIDIVARRLMQTENSRVLASNGYKRIHDPGELESLGAVKVAVSPDGLALNYSRKPILDPGNRSGNGYRQLGLYAFHRAGLEAFAALQPGPKELAESIEMLRFLEHGYDVAMVQVPDDEGIPVDTPADLERVSHLMKAGARDAGRFAVPGGANSIA